MHSNVWSRRKESNAGMEHSPIRLPLGALCEGRSANMKRRNHIPVETKRAAWCRAKGHCEECQMKLVEHFTVNIPEERVEFSIQVWNGHECWRCHALGRIVQLAQDGYGVSYLDDSEWGEIVRKRYPFFQPDYSYTMEETYYANHCESCGALQGDHYIRDWFIENRLETPDVIEPLPEIECYEPAESYRDKRFLPFQIHHRNNDPSDASLDNLQVLCPPCHRRKHASSRAAED